MKVCRYANYRDILSAAKNTELFSGRNGLTNLTQNSSLLRQLKPRHLWPLIRHSPLMAREAWSKARRNHGRFAELEAIEATRYRRPIRAFLQDRGNAGMPATIDRHLAQAARTRSLCLCRDLVWP